jgi:hypothetical protein
MSRDGSRWRGRAPAFLFGLPFHSAGRTKRGRTNEEEPNESAPTRDIDAVLSLLWRHHTVFSVTAVCHRSRVPDREISGEPSTERPIREGLGCPTRATDDRRRLPQRAPAEQKMAVCHERPPSHESRADCRPFVDASFLGHSRWRRGSGPKRRSRFSMSSAQRDTRALRRCLRKRKTEMGNLKTVVT